MRDLLLKQIPLFQSLPDQEVRFLAENLQVVTFDTNTFLFREGDQGDHFYIILAGEVEVLKALADGDHYLIGVRGPGEYVGEMSLLNPAGLRTASLRARTAVETFEITRADFDSLLSRQPDLAYPMIHVFSERLTLSNDTTIRSLRQKNEELTQAYAELQAAQAQMVEKARLDRELDVAHDIQQSMLPSILPRLAGFEFGAIMKPARQVGGDFYDFVPIDNHHIGIAIADVSGKGVSAAMFMALSRSLLRAEASRSLSPQTVLLNVNRHLLDMNATNMFVTILYGVLDQVTHQFHFVRAGHEPPLLIEADGRLSPIPQSQGQPVGLFDTPFLEEQTLTLMPGQTVLFYTDGVTDQLDTEKNFWGTSQLQQALQTYHHKPAQAICDHLINEIYSFGGLSEQSDDITLVVVHASA
jgi:serine phosphatase RsbU (regulator of sigma subunit)